MKRRAVFSIGLTGLLVLLFVKPGLVTTIAAPVITGNSPYGGQIYKIVIDPVSPNTLYAAASDGGVFKSTDSGAHWAAAGLTGKNTLVLIVDPNNVNTIDAERGWTACIRASTAAM